MASKADLEIEDGEYWRLARRARDEVNAGELLAAIRSAQTSWPHITGMLQYARKYGESPAQSIETIEIVLRYAPVVFDRDSLNRATDLLKSQKAIVKSDSSLPERLRLAQTQLGAAHKLWDHLERNPNQMQSELRETFGGSQEWWRWLAEVWEQQGYVRRVSEGRSYRLVLTTAFDQKVQAKCSGCGAVVVARKQRMWDDAVCPACSKTVSFVLI